MPKIFIYRLPQDDPSKNTSVKMSRFGFAQLVDSVRHLPRGSILLDPTAKPSLTPGDREAVMHRGLSIIDCSWKKAVDLHGRLPRHYFIRRRLPFLIAVNPAHYGKPYILSTIEATAAALYILGFREEANAVLRLYKWGLNFLNINAKYLERYAANDLTPERELLGIDDVEEGIKHLIAALLNGR